VNISLTPDSGVSEGAVCRSGRRNASISVRRLVGVGWIIHATWMVDRVTTCLSQAHIRCTCN
jgi:hypothetical protein